LISDSASTRSAVADVKLDVIVSERDGQNNTLDVSTCDAEENQTPDPEDNAKDLYGNSVSTSIISQKTSPLSALSRPTLLLFRLWSRFFRSVSVKT